MRLKKVRIRNFRCFKEETSIDFGEITALIGKNDSGKSTIMEALDIFLNENNPDEDDATKKGNKVDLTIICEFDNLPEEVVIDDKNPTSLTNEFLLNIDRRLEIHKTFSGNLKNPKCSSIKAYAVHPTAHEAIDLLQLKNPDLKKRAKSLGVDLSDIDQKLNAPIREKIRDHIGELVLKESMIPLNEDNANKIWTELRKYLPAFALFKSDRSSTDQDPEAQDPLKAAVKEAIKQKEGELNEIIDHVETEVKKIAQSTLNKLKEMDPSLATQLTPKFSKPRWESLFKASITSDDEIPINKRGSGVKRLILLNFFRAKAEQSAKETGHNFVIYGIEEPETSQHPNNQRILLRALCDLSTDSQVIISTHTPMLARGLPDSSLRYIHICENKKRQILPGGNDTNELFVQSLGVLPDNNVKLFIGVEGKHDISFFQNISKILKASGEDVIDLEKDELSGEIIFFPLGGSNLALWTSRLENLNKPEFHLYDRDESSPRQAKYQNYIDTINARANCKARSTEKKEMENYLNKDAIEAAYQQFNVSIAIANNYADFDDVPLEVAKLVHAASSSDKDWEDLNPKNMKEKTSKAKHILNSFATNYMTKDMLDERDSTGDVLSWFTDIKNLKNT
jgi:putative ATP-dependent endonuclease of the OLD family